MRPSTAARTSALWLQLLLVGGLASVAILFVQTYRAARTSHAVTERALRDYGAFAAWSYREHLSADLRSAIDEVLGPVNHGGALHLNPPVPDAARMGHLLRWNPACNCHETLRGPLPLHFYAYVLGSDTMGVAHNYRQQGRGWLGDPVEGEARTMTVPVVDIPRDDAAVDQPALHRRRAEPRDTDLALSPLRRARGDSTRVLASRLMPTGWGDTLVYGVEYAPPAIDTLFRSAFVRSDLLPPTLVKGRTNADLLDIEVS